MSALLEVERLAVCRDRRTLLTIPSLAIAPGETLAVIGPNGAGKSTLLLALANVLYPTEGEIRFRSQAIGPGDDLAYRRRIALVLQDPLLFDGSVAENVAAGLRFRHLPAVEVAQQVDQWLERLGITHLKHRPARKLSGGEAQRVSLARAFALKPEVLLLDEPFHSLDAPMRARLLEDLHSLLRAVSPYTTTVFVTHDLDEALRLGDRAAVLIGGRLRQVGTPQVVFTAPADPDVAAFVGVETILAGKVIGVQDGLLIVEAHRHLLESVGDVQVGGQVYCCLRPEDVTLWEIDASDDSSPGGDVLQHSSARNRLNGAVRSLMPQGPLMRVALDLDCGFPLAALITRASAQQMGLKPGLRLQAAFKASAVHLIPHLMS